MIDKKAKRLKRAKKVRYTIKASDKARLTIFRTPKHIYAQIISNDSSTVLASASTVGKSFELGATGNIDAAAKIGELIAKKATEKGITEVAFDRSGFKYHGRVKALADAARENGLKF